MTSMDLLYLMVKWDCGIGQYVQEIYTKFTGGWLVNLMADWVWPPVPVGYHSG